MHYLCWWRLTSIRAGCSGKSREELFCQSYVQPETSQGKGGKVFPGSCSILMWDMQLWYFVAGGDLPSPVWLLVSDLET